MLKHDGYLVTDRDILPTGLQIPPAVGDGTNERGEKIMKRDAS